MPTHRLFYGDTEAGKPLDRALRFARQHGKLPVFAKETEKGRTIIVCDHTHLFMNYLNVPLSSRACYHEYIVGPCNLFIDIDADRHGNPQLYTDDKACELILKTVLQQLHSRFHIKESQVQIVDLDSSDEHKLSRHLILNLSHHDLEGSGTNTTIAWKSSRECGAFMRQVIALLPERTYPGLYARGEKKNAQHTASSCIVDMQVYGNRRSLRTYMSAKPGCPWRLLRSKEERKANCTTPQLVPFFQSLVCYFLGNEQKKQLKLLQFSPEKSSSTLTAEAALLFAQLPRTCRKRFRTGGGDTLLLDDCPASYLECVKQALPFRLYGLKYNAEKQTLLTWAYNKQCELAGHEHEKNNVYYVFDFTAGVYRQGCLNETHGCSKKRGQDRPIPGHTPPPPSSSSSSSTPIISLLDETHFPRKKKRLPEAPTLSLAPYFPRRFFPLQ